MHTSDLICNYQYYYSVNLNTNVISRILVLQQAFVANQNVPDDS